MLGAKKKISNYSLGSDVELFLQEIESSEFISAENIIKGTKKEPFKFDPENKYYATSLDAVLAEGNIEPVTTAFDFYKALEKLRKYIDSTLPEGVRSVAQASARLGDKWLQTESAKTLGCDPSLCCWTDEETKPEYKGSNIYAAGFHIHCGYEESTKEINKELIKAMDLFLGIPSVLLEPKNDRRSTGYGQAGNYRHQPYGGVEYRSLSSHFASGKDLIQWCFRNTERAIEFVNSGDISKITLMGDIIQQTINEENKTLAEHLCKEFKVELI